MICITSIPAGIIHKYIMYQHRRNKAHRWQEGLVALEVMRGEGGWPATARGWQEKGAAAVARAAGERT